MPTRRQLLQRDILKKRGLESEYYGGLKPQEIVPDSSKTLAMRLIEVRFGIPIEELLKVEQYENLEPIAKKLGIDISTVCKWRLKLGLREPRDRTPHDA
jgi:hypothetical protein